MFVRWCPYESRLRLLETSAAVSFMCSFWLRPGPVLQSETQRFLSRGKGHGVLQNKTKTMDAQDFPGFIVQLCPMTYHQSNKKKTQQHRKHEWLWTKQVDEGPYWCYYTHMKWDPSVSWGGVLGDCGRGGGECDRLFTARKKSDMLSALTRHTHQKNKKNKKTELHQQLMIKQPKKTTTIMDQINCN